MPIPSIEYLEGHGVFVIERVTIIEPNYVLTSRGWERDGMEATVRDYFDKERTDKRKVPWFYNPSGNIGGVPYGENPHYEAGHRYDPLPHPLEDANGEDIRRMRA